MSTLNRLNQKLMNVGGDEYKRDSSGIWHSSINNSWVKCSQAEASFLSWCASN